MQFLLSWLIEWHTFSYIDILFDWNSMGQMTHGKLPTFYLWIVFFSSKYLQRLIKNLIFSALIIGVLSTIIVTCFLSTNGYSAVLRSFNYNCVSGATVTFKNISTDMDAYQSTETKSRIDARNRATHDLSQEFHSYYLPKIEQNPDNGTTAKTQTDQFLKKESATNHTTTTERSSILQESTNNLTKDIKVFENCMPNMNLTDDVFHSTHSFVAQWFLFSDEIDEINTQWGKEECCSLFYYYPIVEITVAFVWITLIMISGPRPRP